MSDERISYAGDLGTDALGKRVRVTTLTGVVIEDVLQGIRHFIDNRDAGKPKVWLCFENAAPANEFGSSDGNGFYVAETSHVNVGPER